MYRNQNSSFYCHHGQNTNEILNTKTNSVYKVNIYSLSTIVCKHGRSDEELSTYLVCSMLTVCHSYRQTQFFVVSTNSVQYSIWLIYRTATYTHFCDSTHDKHI